MSDTLDEQIAMRTEEEVRQNYRTLLIDTSHDEIEISNWPRACCLLHGWRVIAMACLGLSI